MHYVVTYNVININQQGFVPKRSTSTQLVETRYDWCSGLDNHGIFDVITIDFHKAFDFVPHTKLISKIAGLGVCS